MRGLWRRAVVAGLAVGLDLVGVKPPTAASKRASGAGAWLASRLGPLARAGVVGPVAMTGSADSPLGKLADVCLVVDSRETNYRTDAMVSRIAEIALMDTIFSGLVVSMGPEALDRLASSRQGLSYLKF